MAEKKMVPEEGELKKKGRPVKIASPVRFTLYMKKDSLRRLDELAGIFAEEKATMVRRVLDDFIEANKDAIGFRCPCGFVIQSTKSSKEIIDMIKKHEKECKKGRPVKVD